MQDKKMREMVDVCLCMWALVTSLRRSGRQTRQLLMLIVALNAIPVVFARELSVVTLRWSWRQEHGQRGAAGGKGEGVLTEQVVTSDGPTESATNPHDTILLIHVASVLYNMVHSKNLKSLIEVDDKMLCTKPKCTFLLYSTRIQ
jgi:hypothetical protein